MRFRVFPLCVALLLAGCMVWAEGSDERYVQIYNLIQDADATAASGQAVSAIDKYQRAQRDLEELQAALPGWNEAVVQFRLKYISEKLQLLHSNNPSAPARADADASVATAVGPESLIRALKEQIRQMVADREMLQSKLKEALAAQPANVDSREVARSEETIKTLQKELEVLKVRLNEAESKPDRPVSPARLQEAVKDLSEARQKVSEQVEIIASLGLEKKALQTQILSSDQGAQFKTLNDENLRLKQQLEQLKVRVDSAAGSEVLAGQFGGLQRELRAQQARNEMLEAEKKILEDRAAQLEKRRGDEVAEAIRELEKALTDARSAVQTGNATVSALKDSLRASQEARDRLEHEMSATEVQLSSVRSALATERLARIEADASARTSAEELARTKRQRDEFQAQLTAVSKELSDTQTRLQLIEAGRLGGHAKDLNVALVSGHRSGGAVLPQIPPPASAPAVQASTTAANPRIAGGGAAQAGGDQMMNESPVNLAHLAAIQMDQNRLTEAEITLKAALAKNPTNVMSLLMLGQLGIRQGNFEAALERLGQAVQHDPQNAEACNYLGVALMEKGLREPAEFALLRATRLSPGYGEAHFNLAMFYLRQRPPVHGKASEHYQKALAAGHPVDTGVERDLKQSASAFGNR